MFGRSHGGGRGQGGITREQSVQPANFGLSMTRGRGRGRGHSAFDSGDQAPIPPIRNGNDTPWPPVPLMRGRGRGGLQLSSSGLGNMEPVVPVATRGRGDGRAAWGVPPTWASSPPLLSGDVPSSGLALNISHPVPRGCRGGLRYSKYCVPKPAQEPTVGEPEPILPLTSQVDDVAEQDHSSLQPTVVTVNGTEPQLQQGGANAANRHCPQCSGNNNSQAILGIIADFIDAMSLQFVAMSEKIAMLTRNNQHHNEKGAGDQAPK